ncbi:histone deacetylase domain-containing protein [Jimgerdemannia flammicorona]|uniref:Histone deacetylase domain-containing protein n=1 Tax=Jimgerdemannia flammicorona TaxID=994334 RepID=A0A433BF18_9FUNG|nr:histone deacetylase domain-containing protein [Jimgerdemannia flammicorona]
MRSPSRQRHAGNFRRPITALVLLNCFDRTFILLNFGTQDIAWHLNKLHFLPPDSDASVSFSDPDTLPTGVPLRVFYGSTHDILSYPCEGGDDDFVQAASIRLLAHDQAVWNVHLEPWSTAAEHDALYDSRYREIITKAREWLRRTDADPAKTVIFISCGFDASEYEHRSMQRHGRSVPASFYHRFTCDAVDLARECAQGRIISVLEGGYSDRALVAGAAAHVVALARGCEGEAFVALPEEVEAWWDVQELEAIEKRVLSPAGKTKKTVRKGAGGEILAPERPALIERVAELVAAWEAADKEVVAEAVQVVVPQPLVTGKHNLRERKRQSDMGYGAGAGAGAGSPAGKG